MRLVCPNCDSEYEVDRAMIPADGRDVQCSNCMHTWFQPGEVDTPFDTEPEPIPQTAEPEPIAPQAFDEDSAYDPAQVETPVGEMPVKAPALSDEARSLFEEEVARDSEARKAEQAALETQMDMDLDAGPAMDPTKNRVARIRRDVADKVRAKPTPAEDEAPYEAAPEPEPAPEPTAKKDLLPDIEEINSNWDEPTEAPVYDADEGPLPTHPDSEQSPVTGSGFKIGFFTVIGIAILIVLLYLIAPFISDRVSALSPVFSGYVGLIDGWRTWLEQVAQSWIASPPSDAQG